MSVLALDLWCALPCMCPVASPSIIPRLLSPGTQAACDRYPVGYFTPSPSFAQHSGEAGASLTGRQDGASRAPARESVRDWGSAPRCVRPGGWLGSTVLVAAGWAGAGGSSRSCWSVCLPKGLGSTTPTSPNPTHSCLAPSAATPLPTGCLSWSGVILMP